MLNKNPDCLTEKEKIILGIDTIKQFFDSLGENDVYKQIVLEEIMRFLKNEPND